MAKPASGTALDTGHALYTSLTAAWAMLEGSGSTSADSKGSHTLTLGDSAVWTTISGEAAISIPSPAGSSAQPLAVASPFTLAGSGSWTVAWRGKQTSSGTAGVFIGDKDDVNNFIWMDGGSFLRFRSAANTSYDFSVTVFTADHNYVLSYDQPGAKLHLYVDGTEVGTGLTVTANDAAFSIDTLGNGYSAGNLALVGTLTCVFVWDGRALSGAEATTWSGAPYGMFTGGATAVGMVVSRRSQRMIRSLLTR